jgi:hypothetical protein
MATAPRFASDRDLRYAEQAFRFEPARALRLDGAYRANQLPLANPGHPDVVARVAGEDGEMGRYATARVSLVVFTPLDDLLASPPYRELVARHQRSRLAPWIAWDLLDRRRDRIHATVCARLTTRLDPAELGRRLACLRQLAPFALRVTGPWVSGVFNLGRIYLPIYPEVRDGVDVLRSIQRAMGWTETGFYAIGLFNLLDHLGERETAELGEIVAAYRDTAVLELAVRELAVVATHDDLLLDSTVVERIPLGGP